MEEIPPLYDCTNLGGIHGSGSHIWQLPLGNRCVRRLRSPERRRRDIDGRDFLHVSGSFHDHDGAVFQYLSRRPLINGRRIRSIWYADVYHLCHYRSREYSSWKSHSVGAFLLDLWYWGLPGMGDGICGSLYDFAVLTKINLARDFGPRLFSWMAGYGTEVWTAGNYYFWVSFGFRLLTYPRFPW
jgi:hypothetical protein